MKLRESTLKATGSLCVLLILLFIAGCSIFPDDQTDISPDGNELKIPVLLEDLDDNPDEAHFELNVDYGRTRFVEGYDAETLGYNGSYLGPVIRLKRGEKVTIDVKNNLAESTTVHWHGLEVDAEDDGGPHHGILPRDTWTPEFIVDRRRQRYGIILISWEQQGTRSTTGWQEL